MLGESTAVYGSYKKRSKKDTVIGARRPGGRPGHRDVDTLDAGRTKIVHLKGAGLEEQEGLAGGHESQLRLRMPQKKAQTNQERSRQHDDVALGGGGKFLQMFGGDVMELRFFINLENTDATLR